MRGEVAALTLAIPLVLSLPLAPIPADASGTPTVSTTMAVVPEDAVLQLQEKATAQGALGIYRAGSDYVVVRPTSRSDLTSADFSVAGLTVRVKAIDIEPSTLDRLSDVLEQLSSTVEGSFGFGFDPESGKMMLQSEVPPDAFATVMDTFPGLIDFREGKWDLAASWTNDAQPHWGGAWLWSSSTLCTSGFSIADNNGNRYMATAGHCFAQGTSTNMGTAWRPSDGYPYYDFEFITGHSVAGYMYDSATSGRRVKNAADPGVGYTYCATGRTSGFNCDWTVRRINQTMCYGPNGACYHSLAAFDRPSNESVQDGDSGGPLWVRYSDGTAGVRGVVSGRFWDATTFHFLSYATQYQQVANFYVMHAIIP